MKYVEESNNYKLKFIQSIAVQLLKLRRTADDKKAIDKSRQ